jgi:hypothetical protein
MATTTNYSWSTPDDTALVKDGAAAIRSLGTAIDTTVFTNAGAAINKTIVDAKGDLIVASGADAVARLAVGTNDHVLTADSGATNGIKWAALPAAGGITLLSTTTLSGASTTVSSISGAYTNLMVIVRSVNYSGNATMFIATNITNVSYIGTPNGTYAKSAASIGQLDDGFVGGTSANTSNVMTMIVYGYSNTSGNKSFHVHGGYFNSDQKAVNVFGSWNSSSAINSVTITPSTGTFNGGTLLVYGIS